MFVDQLRAAFVGNKLRLPGGIMDLADPAAFAVRLDAPAMIDWAVDTKPPFAGAEQVLGYLARCTHRFAIADGRLVGTEDGQVGSPGRTTTRTARPKIMTLPAD